MIILKYINNYQLFIYLTISYLINVCEISIMKHLREVTAILRHSSIHHDISMNFDFYLKNQKKIFVTG